MRQALDFTRLVQENENYRQVLATGKQSQVVMMSLPPGEELSEEVHPSVDQLFVVAGGKGEILIDNKLFQVGEHFGAFVPAGTKHAIRCTGKKPLKLFMVYAPPVHAPELVERFAPKIPSEP